MIRELEQFVKPFYKERDMMHDLLHIKRILKIAKSLAKKYKANLTILTYGAYFHGMISHEKRIKLFLKKQNLLESRINKILLISKESQNNAKPKTIEGKILHDANLIEGGKTFLITKSLITGTVKGQSLMKTINFIEKNVLGKFKCCLPETQKIYKEKEDFARDFLKNVKNHL